MDRSAMPYPRVQVEAHRGLTERRPRAGCRRLSLVADDNERPARIKRRVIQDADDRDLRGKPVAIETAAREVDEPPSWAQERASQLPRSHRKCESPRKADIDRWAHVLDPTSDDFDVRKAEFLRDQLQPGDPPSLRQPQPESPF